MNVTEALAVAADLPGDVVVAGGGEVYRLALPLATHQVLTEVDLEVPDADTFFPDFDETEWKELGRATVTGEGVTGVVRELLR